MLVIVLDLPSLGWDSHGGRGLSTTGDHACWAKPTRTGGRRPSNSCTGPAVATSGPRSPPRDAFAPSVAFGLGLRVLAAGPAHFVTVLLLKGPGERPANLTSRKLRFTAPRSSEIAPRRSTTRRIATTQGAAPASRSRVPTVERRSSTKEAGRRPKHSRRFSTTRGRTHPTSRRFSWIAEARVLRNVRRDKPSGLGWIERHAAAWLQPLRFWSDSQILRFACAVRGAARREGDRSER